MSERRGRAAKPVAGGMAARGVVEGAEVTEDGGRVRTRRGGSSGGAKGSPWLLYVFRVVNADNESRDGEDRRRAARLCSASRSN